MKRDKLRKIAGKLQTIVSSVGFLRIIVIFFILEALWIALSFRFPMLYDEAFHFDAIKLFSHQWSPIITEQPNYYDIYGSLIGGGATLFHYVMSLPDRLLSIFTDNLAVHVISLRILCIALAAYGLFIYAKVLDVMNIRRIYTNIGILIFVLLPIVPFIAATISYDNLLFTLTALFFLLSARIVKDKNLSYHRLVTLLGVGLFASMVKFTFLPIFAVAVIFILALLLKRKGLSFLLKRIKNTFLKTRFSAATIIVTILFVLSAALFSLTYIKNIIVYHSLQPSCEKVMTVERCSKSSGEKRNNDAISTKDTRPLVRPPEYASQWYAQMINWTNMSGSRTTHGTVITKPLPIIYTTIFFAALLGIGLTLLAWRSLKKNEVWYFMLAMSITLILAVFWQNYAFYIEIHAPYAIQPRYLLTIAPFLIVLPLVATNYLISRYKKTKIVIFIIFLLLIGQGAGLTTHILRSDGTWYWNSETVRRINTDARNVLSPLIKE